MPFRKAKSIELHEAHTIITLSDESYAFSSPTARSEQADRPAFHIRLADVNRIAKMLGYNPQQKTREILDRSGRPIEMGDIQLPIMREYFEVPSDEPSIQILNLECDVQGPNLVEIRIETRQENTPADMPNSVETITHSGSFTIWWDREKPATAEQLFAQAEAHPRISVEPGVSQEPGSSEDDLGLLLDDLGEKDT